MTFKRLTTLAQEAPDHWRDWVLAGLTPLLLIDLFVVAPLGAAHLINVRPFRATMLTLLALGLLFLSRSIAPVICLVVAIGLNVVAFVLHLRGGSPSVDISLEGFGRLLIAAVIIWVVGRAVLSPGRITYHRVIGAVLLYLAIGLLFVGLYTLVDVAHPGSFKGMAVVDELPLPSEFVYFSFTTLTTVGFGDVVPVNPIARSLCNVESIIGQLYPATLLAYLISFDVSSRR
ncbi:MAG: potassium channel family protein [Reyranellaceae bacterium]